MESFTLIRACEILCLFFSTTYILANAYLIAPIFAVIYAAFIILVLTGRLELRARRDAMPFTSPLALINAFLTFTIILNRLGLAIESPAPVITGSPPAYARHGETALMAAEKGDISELVRLRLGSESTTDDSTEDVAPAFVPNVEDANAIDAQTVCPGYSATDVQASSSGVIATLKLAGPACNAYGTDIDTLNLVVQYQDLDRLSVNIFPSNIDSSNSSWYLLPTWAALKPGIGSFTGQGDLEFSWDNDPTFSFTVTRRSTGDVLFSTKGTKIVYENQFIEFVSPLPENYNLYGLGEVIHGLRLGNNLTRTIYAADISTPIDRNIYGSHPIYIDTRYYTVNADGTQTLVTNDTTDPTKEYTSYSHGLYNRNAHGQEILLRDRKITWRAIGGSIDLYFYAGPTPQDVISSYQKSGSGLPAMHQYWTLGFHQCRWGYQNWSIVEEVVANYSKASIPLETIWTDIDYMLAYRNFENDPKRFSYARAETFLAELHGRGQHYIPIIDAAVYIPYAPNASDNYPTFDRGNAKNSFMLNPDGSLYVGEVWPGYTVFPDFLPGTGANEWWVDEVTRWHDKVKFDGIWIDMNEVSSFCQGSCGSKNRTQKPGPQSQLTIQPGSGSSVFVPTADPSPSPANALMPANGRATVVPGVRDINSPPYSINHIHGILAEHAVSPNATHHDGTQEYDVHSLFGHQLLNSTYNSLVNIEPTKRPFIIGRSTFVGSGTVAGHWGGDNFSKWFYLYASIPQALSFSIFGMPMFGVDTCGFWDATNEQLCNRWMQLSAFFPFYRNHNALGNPSQEVYIWQSVTNATLKAMDVRFQLLPYMYTLFDSAHKTGSTVMRALAWEFPNDPSLANADRQFFLGPAILVTPVLTENAVTVDGVFPGSGRGELYYDWYTQTPVAATAGKNTTIDAPLGNIPVYIRGGYIIPTQQMAMTTRDARQTPWNVVVALNAKGEAKGRLYLDDGESINPASSLYINLDASDSKLQVDLQGSFTDSNPLANVTILGVKSQPSNVRFNGQAVGSGSNSTAGFNATTNAVQYDTSAQKLVIQGLGSKLSGGAWSERWTLEW